MQSGITRRHAGVAGAVVGTVAAIRTNTNDATVWQAYTYNPGGTVAPVEGFKRVITNFEKASSGSVAVNLHLGGSLPIAGNNITQAVSENVVQLADDGCATCNIPIAAELRLPVLLLIVSDMLKAMAILRRTLIAIT